MPKAKKEKIKKEKANINETTLFSRSLFLRKQKKRRSEKRKMDFKTYNLLCGASNKPPMNCLVDEDYFLEKIGGNDPTFYYFKDVLKNKENWAILMEWLQKYHQHQNLHV